MNTAWLENKTIYIPKSASNNGTEATFTYFFQNIGCNLLFGRENNETATLKKADIIIPATTITEEFFNEKLNEHSLTNDRENIQNALSLAKHVHSGQKRKSGTDYFTGHILPTTLFLIITEIKKGNTISTETIIAALLHDIVEDSEETITFDKNNKSTHSAISITEEFGETVADIVKTLTKIPVDEYLNSSAFRSQDMFELYNSMNEQDKWEFRNQEYARQIYRGSQNAKLIKCADRLLNITDDIKNLSDKHDVDFVTKYIYETKMFYRGLFQDIVSHNDLYFLTLETLLTVLDSMAEDNNT